MEELVPNVAQPKQRDRDTCERQHDMCAGKRGSVVRKGWRAISSAGHADPPRDARAYNRAMDDSRRASDHDHPPQDEQRIREAALDETIADTFPASDPLSSDPNPYDDTAVDVTEHTPAEPGPRR